MSPRKRGSQKSIESFHDAVMLIKKAGQMDVGE
jgi:hypothetical protein